MLSVVGTVPSMETVIIMYSNNLLFLHFFYNSTWKLLVSTKYFLVKYKYKYKYFDISIHQVLKYIKYW